MTVQRTVTIDGTQVAVSAASSAPTTPPSLSLRGQPDPHGMVVLSGVAMNRPQRPHVRIPNGTPKIHPTLSGIDTWSPSALKLGFFYGTDPNPDLRGGGECEQNGDPGSNSGCASDGEEEYVTLDYNYPSFPSRTNSHKTTEPMNYWICPNSTHPVPGRLESMSPRSSGVPQFSKALKPSKLNTQAPIRVDHGRVSLPAGFENYLNSKPHPQVYHRQSSLVDRLHPRENPSMTVARSKAAESGVKTASLPHPQGITLNVGEGMHRKRSLSLPDLQGSVENGGAGSEVTISSNYSDDEDGDEFGFLNSPFASPPPPVIPVMHKAKSPSPTHKILPKRWRSKAKTATVPVVSSTLWSPEGCCTWCSVSGRKVVLKPTSLLQLSDAERLALQKVVLSKLQAMELGCQVVIPKENTDVRRSQRKHALTLKRRSKSANLASVLDSVAEKNKEKEKDCQPMGLVFGIPLSKCISNDKELQKRRSTVSNTLQVRSDGSDGLSSREPRKSSSSSQSSIDNLGHNGNVNSSQNAFFGNKKRTASSDSLSESESSRNTSSSLIDALSLSLSGPASRQGSLKAGHVHMAGVPEVPHIVYTCFEHIETYGLRVLGIFRVGSSKKRVKQLRDEFDCGKAVQLNSSHNPHDVGALLKEYFRDLPEPLLTRDLYAAFVATRKIDDRQKQLCVLNWLLSLLPVPNRDTFWALLKFLAKVSEHSKDGVDEDGHLLPGNKMDTHNLATLFGPNILHKAKSSSEKEFQVESAERAEQSKEVIEVVKDMIDNHEDLFELDPILRDEALKVLMQTDPEAADKVLKQLANDVLVDPDPDTSSSVFDDSDTPSLPHSPSSDADLLNQSRRLAMTHPPVRVSRSAEPSTVSVHKRSGVPGDDRWLSASQDSGSRHWRTRPDSGPSLRPPPSPRTSQTPRLKVSRSSASPEVLLRQSVDARERERPYSESYMQSLTIPKPSYYRENSASSVSSINSAGGPDSGGQWLLPTPPVSRSNSPNPLRRSSSQHRPLNVGENEEVAPPVGSAAWQRERWKHWEMIAAENANGGENCEQETLV